MSDQDNRTKVIKTGDPFIERAMRKVERIIVQERHIHGYWDMIRSEKLHYDISSKYSSAVNSISISSSALYYFLNNFSDVIPETGQRGSSAGYHFYLYGAFNAAYVQQDGLRFIYNLSTDFKRAYDVPDNSAWSKIRDLRIAGFAHPTNYTPKGEPHFVQMMYFGGLVMSAHDGNHSIDKIPVTQTRDFLKLFSDFRCESVNCLQQCAVELDKLKDVAIRKVKKQWDDYYS